MQNLEETMLVVLGLGCGAWLSYFLLQLVRWWSCL